GEVDPGDLGSALAAEPLLGPLVPLAIVGSSCRVGRGFDHRTAQVLRAVLGERATAVLAARLADERAESGVPGQLLWAREPSDVADLRSDRVREHPADTGHGH